MQQNYRYWRTEPEGEHFAEDFAPELTPAEMLRLGANGVQMGSRFAASVESNGSDELKKVVKSEVERLLKKYNLD